MTATVASATRWRRVAGSFLDARRTQDGLFREVGERLPTLEAQRFALECEDVLDARGVPTDPRPLRRLLAACARSSGGFAAAAVEPDADFGSTYYAARLARRIGALPEAAATAGWIRRRALDGSEQAVDLDDLYYAVRALLVLSVRPSPSERAAISARLARCAAPDGGFSVLPGRPPDIERTYCAVHVARLLRLPLDATAHGRWVAACAGPRGIAWDPDRLRVTPATLYWGTRAARLLGIALPAEVLVDAALRFGRADGGFGTSRSTIWETFCACRTLAAEGLP